MPLVRGPKAKTKQGFQTNLRKELESGKKKSQALAIAYSLKRGKNKKK